VTSRAGRRFENLSLDSNLGPLSARWERQADGAVTITAELDATVLRENTDGTHVLGTNAAAQSELKIPVRVYVRRYQAGT